MGGHQLPTPAEDTTSAKGVKTTHPLYGISYFYTEPKFGADPGTSRLSLAHEHGWLTLRHDVNERLKYEPYSPPNSFSILFSCSISRDKC